MKKLVFSSGCFLLAAVLSGCEPGASPLDAGNAGGLAQETQVVPAQELATSAFSLEADSDPCKGETYEGRCLAKTLIWCEEYKIRVVECKRACGWDRSNLFYNCL